MSTKSIVVYDPPMCCSTGVCGPTVDPKLLRFSADLEWIQKNGANVRRFNLAQEPGAFAEDPAVKKALHDKGDKALPLVQVDGELKSQGRYPSRQELSDWVGLDEANGTKETIYTEAVSELVALGAAIASNCEPCFKFHYDKARKIGVSRNDMMKAVKTAQMVKESPAKQMLDLADRYLAEKPASGQERHAGCCGSAPSGTPPASGKGKSGCC